MMGSALPLSKRSIDDCGFAGLPFRLHQLIENHQQYTGSERAAEILANWDEFRPKFVKVMPTEYRRALAEIEAAQNAAGVAAE